MARSNVQSLHQAVPIQHAPRNQLLPLSFDQERLWQLKQLQAGDSVHNILHSFRLVGALDVAALEQSLAAMVLRHESFAHDFPGARGATGTSHFA